MSLPQGFIIFLSLIVVACGPKLEVSVDNNAVGMDLQTFKPGEIVSRIDCEVELQASNGQVIRLADTSKVFKMKEVTDAFSPKSSVVIPLSTFSLMARYSTESLDPKKTGPAFYTVLCKNNLALNEQCPSESVIKFSERNGTLTSTVDNDLDTNLKFQHEQYQITQVRSHCTLNVQTVN